MREKKTMAETNMTLQDVLRYVQRWAMSFQSSDRDVTIWSTDQWRELRRVLEESAARVDAPDMPGADPGKPLDRCLNCGADMTVVRVVACCAHPVPGVGRAAAQPERARWTEERIASLLDRIRPERPGYANARDACECIGALAFERKQLEGQVADLRKALVEAAIPLEAIVMAAGSDERGEAVDPNWKEIRAAVETIRQTLASNRKVDPPSGSSPITDFSAAAVERP